MRRSARFFTATILTVGLTAAGFAGVASAADQLSQKAFLKQGSAVCKAANKEIEAVFERVFADLKPNETPSPEAQAAAVAGAVPIFRDALSEIDALKGPASIEKKVAKVLDQYETVVVALEADPVAAFEGADPFAKADKAAVKVGLKQCSQGG